MSNMLKLSNGSLREFLFKFRRMISIFCAKFACGVSITSKFSDYQYDLGVKDHGQIYLESALRLVIQILLSVLAEGVNI